MDVVFEFVECQVSLTLALFFSSSSLIACFDYPLGPFLACSLTNGMGMRPNGLKRVKKREDEWADMDDFVIILGATRTWKLIKLIKFNHRHSPTRMLHAQV